jgi:putative lipoic acid-binding regulatory protein
MTTASIDDLFEFPCDFPLKIMGKAHPDFIETMALLLQGFDPDFDRARIEIRPSSSGKYIGLTCFVRATSRAHLDDIYRAISGHPMVSVAL